MKGHEVGGKRSDSGRERGKRDDEVVVGGGRKRPKEDKKRCYEGNLDDCFKKKPVGRTDLKYSLGS